jgi:hypothetical protein
MGTRNRMFFAVLMLFITSPNAVMAQDPASTPAPPGVELRFEVREPEKLGYLPCRIHVSDGSETLFAPPDAPAFMNHFSCEGTATLSLPPGDYTYAIERGPEYTRAEGKVSIDRDRGASHEIKETLSRIADLAAEGWWSGDLHVHRPPDHMETLMRVEDLHVAPVITWWNKRNFWKDRPIPNPLLLNFDGDRYYHLMAGEDERGGGAFMIYNLDSPIDITQAEREYPSQVHYLPEARARGAWIDLEKPFWWDGPVGIGLSLVDSIGIANNHMWRHGMLDNEAWGRPRSHPADPPAHGSGVWTQEIYYHLLNAGLRIPPSAGSASGVIPNPVGYNRVYVQLDSPLTYEAWWEGLRAGRSFVTNGPLLRVKANGEWPGHVFKAPAGRPLNIQLEGALISNDPISRIQVVKDGEIALDLPAEALLNGSAPVTVSFDRSGWFLVRAIADLDFTFRFASTAPFYVEVGGEPRRVHRESVQFFLDWIDQRKVLLELGEAQKAEVLGLHDRARTFWSGLLAESE